MYNVNRKNGIKINSNFRLRFSNCEASNFVTKICEVPAKTPHNENIFVKLSIFSLNSLPNQKFNNIGYIGNIKKINVGITFKKIFIV